MITVHLTPQEAVDDVLAATAHELRLPLSHIKGFVSSLLRSDVAWDAATCRDFLAEIEIETDRLTRLIEQLLGACAAPGATPGISSERRTVSPAALVGAGLHRVRGLLGDRAVRVDLPGWLPMVRVDVDAVERVFANLLHNAGKYSPARGCIEVSARQFGLEAVDIDIDDQGPGVPNDERHLIFDPYVRGRSAGSSASGRGLGLTICQAIMKANGGHIRVADAPNGGARFTVRLPVELPTAVDR
jgi:two-component system sensor histidine kinase KdpD